MIGRIWGQRAVSSTGAPYQPGMEGDLVFSAIEALAPQNDVQRNLKFRALATTSAITEARVLLFEEADAGLPTALLVVVVFWLTMLFAGFTLFSPINATSAAVLAIIALSASGAIFLILELNHPFGGLMQISSAPLREASNTYASADAQQLLLRQREQPAQRPTQTRLSDSPRAVALRSVRLGRQLRVVQDPDGRVARGITASSVSRSCFM